MSFSLWIARRMGSVAYYLNQKRRSIGYVNLKAAFGERFGSKQRYRIIKRVYQNLAQNAVEMLSLPKIDLKYIERYVRIENAERTDEALNKKKGLIFLTAHYGNWELSSIVSSLEGYPLKVLAREQKFPLLNQFLNRMRESKGCKVISKGMPIREIIESLKRGEAVGILADQDAGKKGVFVDFFGRPASTAPGTIRMALTTGATILPAFMIREKGPKHRLIIEKPLRIPKSDRDIQSILQNFSQILESHITNFPDQWLWMHKRWKSTPSRSILVLSDGKAGHINQALSVMKVTSDQLPVTRKQVVEVRFKNRFTRTLLAICSLFASKYCQGCMHCLRFCLKRESYEELMKIHFDIVISCGSSLAAVNLFLSKENLAKSIVIMKPGLLSLSKFNLNLIPRHDRPPHRLNVVITEAAPNLIDSKKMAEDLERLKSTCQLSVSNIDVPKVGLLIGGDTKEYLLSKEIMEKVLNEIKMVVERLNGEVLATTSRRTSRGIEILAKEKLANFDKCKLLIIANEKNIEGAVGGILGLSQIVVVSGESVSMVSEAASSGKYVIVFEPQALCASNKPRPFSAFMYGLGRKGRGKHKIFLGNLAERGCIILTRPEEIERKIEEIWQNKPALKTLKDREIISEAVKRVL
jgi:KDO2-lipid IV(A) lauroyltransferase